MDKSKKPLLSQNSRGWIIWSLGASFYCYEYLLRIAPSSMTYELMSTFNIGGVLLGNLTAFYYYAYTPMQLPVGVLMDRFGPRRLLTFACAVCVVGTFLFASTHKLHIAEVGRFLIGFGSAFAFVGVLKLASLWFPSNRFAFMAGLASALGSAGAMVGDVSLTALVEMSGWRETTMLFVGSGTLLTLAIFLFIKDRPSVVYNKRSIPETMPTVSHFVKELLVMFKNPIIWINGAIGCLLYLPATSFAELWGIPYFHQVYHYTNQQAANAISVLFLGFTLGAPLMGLVSDRIGTRRIPIMIGGVLAAGLISVVLYFPTYLSMFWVFTILFVFAICYSAQVVVFAVACESTPREMAGSAIAVTNMLVMIGGAICQPLIGLLLDSRWEGQLVNGARIYPASDFQFALAVLPLGLLAAVIFGFIQKETHPAASRKLKGK